VPLLVHLGRVTLQKNVVGLLDAFRLVLEREPRARLVLAGSLADRGYLGRVHGAHGKLIRGGAVEIRPPVQHAGTLLSAADTYVSNSFFEGWSLAASEAAWTGVPLVLSDCGSARQLVGEGGVRGRVVPNALGDPLGVTWERLGSVTDDQAGANREAMAEAVLEILGEVHASGDARSAEIRARAREELAPARVTGAYAALFRGAART
jgi:glycosyltransferase involved in cell wall biosynthesis